MIYESLIISAILSWIVIALFAGISKIYNKIKKVV